MKIFILTLLFPIFVLGASEMTCLNRMAMDTATPEQNITVMLMECSNMFLKGQFGYLQKETKEHLTAGQKGNALLDYALCEQTSKLFKEYMKMCMEEK